MTASTIARELGCGRNAVIGKAHRLGLVQGLAPAPRVVDFSARTPVTEASARRAEIKRARRLAQVAATREKKAAATPRPLRVGLQDLTEGACRWPVTDGYCARQAARGSYCAEHADIAYVPVKKRDNVTYFRWRKR